MSQSRTRGWARTKSMVLRTLRMAISKTIINTADHTTRWTSTSNDETPERSFQYGGIAPHQT